VDAYWPPRPLSFEWETLQSPGPQLSEAAGIAWSPPLSFPIPPPGHVYRPSGAGESRRAGGCERSAGAGSRRHRPFVATMNRKGSWGGAKQCSRRPGLASDHLQVHRPLGRFYWRSLLRHGVYVHVRTRRYRWGVIVLAIRLGVRSCGRARRKRRGVAMCFLPTSSYLIAALSCEGVYTLPRRVFKARRVFRRQWFSYKIGCTLSESASGRVCAVFL
jgi:hypothetical protein